MARGFTHDHALVCVEALRPFGANGEAKSHDPALYVACEDVLSCADMTPGRLERLIETVWLEALKNGGKNG